MNKIKKGDNVQILLGKDRGKSGPVERVLAKEDKVFVTGLNQVKRHIRRNLGGTNNEGAVIEISKPLNISNVGLVCPSCKKVTRVGFKINGETKTRVCKKCGKEIS